MNILTAQHLFQKAWRLIALLAGMLAASGVRAADAPEPGRFLLVFETSPTLKKNLPAVGHALDALFAGNLQNEMRENDDLAVWTVDQDLHTGTFPLASWSPADAVMYSARLKDFLGRQNFTRHANLAALQPLLNRVVKNSERLTVLIFCDGQGRLLGTPYDSGVNEIITNVTTKAKNVQQPFILVLRSYNGEYLGCSVNRSGLLNFPQFPPPPTPEPPPLVKPAPVAAPAVAAAPVPALIIVGTNASTNLSTLPKLVPQPIPAPVPETNTRAANAPATIAPAANAPATNTPLPAPKTVVKPATKPPPTSNPPAPVNPAPAPVPVLKSTSAPPPVVVVKKTAPPEPVATAPAIVTPTNPPPVVSNAASNSNVEPAAAEEATVDTGSQWPLFLGGGLFVAAAGIVVWLVVRARRPRGSLITTSMQDDPRLPPQK